MLSSDSDEEEDFSRICVKVAFTISEDRMGFPEIEDIILVICSFLNVSGHVLLPESSIRKYPNCLEISVLVPISQKT